MLKHAKKSLAFLTFASLLLSVVFFTQCNEAPPSGPVGGSHQFSKFSLPSGATLVSAELKVYLIDGNDQLVNIYRNTEDWDETTVNWSNRPAFDPTDEGDLMPADADQGTFISANITGLVQKWLNCDEPNYGLLLDQESTTTSYDYSAYSSKEGANPEYLEIVYSIGGVNQPTVQVPAIADAYIWPGVATGNTGFLFTGYVNGAEKQALIKFDLECTPGTCLRMPDDSPCGPLDLELLTSVDGAGDVTVIFNQNTNVVDNSYGTYQVGWGSNAPSGKNHKFGDLVGSDKAQFIFFNANGTKVLDIFVDYISLKSGTPSGYASLGVSGGEGKVNFPSQAVGAAWVLSATTTFDNNLNNLGLCASGNCSGAGTNLLLTSPQTTSSTSYTIVNPVYASWNFVDGYTVKISHDAFGAAGFGSVAIGLVHNSPPKCGDGAYTPVLCSGTPGGESCLDGKPKKLEMKYLGTNCVSSCNTQAAGKVIVTGDPGGATPVYIVAYDKQTTSLVWFQGTVLLNGTFIIDATAKNKTRLGTNTIVKIYDTQGGTLLSTVQFHTSCSQPLNVGDKYGSLEMTNYIAE